MHSKEEALLRMETGHFQGFEKSRRMYAGNKGECRWTLFMIGAGADFLLETSTCPAVLGVDDCLWLGSTWRFSTES